MNKRALDGIHSNNIVSLRRCTGKLCRNLGLDCPCGRGRSESNANKPASKDVVKKDTRIVKVIDIDDLETTDDEGDISSSDNSCVTQGNVVEWFMRRQQSQRQQQRMKLRSKRSTTKMTAYPQNQITKTRNWTRKFEKTPEGLVTLTQGMQQCIKDILNSKDDSQLLLRQIGPVSLTLELIQSLKPKQLVLSGIVDAFFQLLCDRSEDDVCFPKVHYFVVPFSVQFQRENYACNHLIKQWFEKINIFNYDLVFFPVFIPRKRHFVLIIVDCRKQVVTCYDSMGSTNNRGLLQGFLNLVKNLHGNETGQCLPDAWHVLNLNGPKQGESTNNCAIFICRMAEFLSRDEQGDISKIFYIKEENMWFLRKRLVWELVNGFIITP